MSSPRGEPISAGRPDPSRDLSGGHDQEASPSVAGPPSDEFWWAHEQPERPFDRGVLLCACGACGLAVRAASSVDPSFRLVVRGEATRRLVAVAEAAAVAAMGEGLGALVPDDYLRDAVAAYLQHPEVVEKVIARLDRARPPAARPGVATDPPAPDEMRPQGGGLGL